MLCVFGTRPEAIKLAPVIAALRRAPWARVLVCNTGQHRHMLADALRLFGIRPDYDLTVMRKGQGLASLTARLLERLPAVFDRARPGVVVVQGDTTTTMAAALAAHYKGIPVAHVEAGLRTYDLAAPMPEEANRRVADLLACLHFAPTAGNAANLRREGASRSGVVLSGNTVIDALRWAVRKAKARTPRTAAHWRSRFGPGARRAIDAAGGFILVTCHRRESFGPGLERVCRALKTLALRRRDVGIVFPVHLNPNVSGTVRSRLSGIPNLLLTGPLDYECFALLMDRCRLILTDSGGIQEEAPALGKPVLVMRGKSERPEAVACGSAMVVGTDPERIVFEALRLLRSPAHYRRMSRVRHPFGDGEAAARIARALRERFWVAQARRAQRQA